MPTRTDTAGLEELRQRLQALRTAYTRETDALTRQALARSIDGSGADRRQPTTKAGA